MKTKDETVFASASAIVDKVNLNANGENQAIREQMPFSSFVISPDLRIFQRIFLQCVLQEYIPRNAEDKFFASVSPLGNKAKMSVNINKFNKYPVLQQMGVLAHEGCHVALSHLIGSRKGSPKARNIAEDLLINEYLLYFYKGKLDLPKENGIYTCLTFEKFCADGTFKNTIYTKTANGMPHVTRKGIDWKLTELNSDEVFKWVDEDIPKSKDPDNNPDGEPRDEDGDGEGNGDGNGEVYGNQPTDKETDQGGGSGRGKETKEEKEKRKANAQKTVDELDKLRIDNHDGGLTKDNTPSKLQKVMGDLLRAAEDGHYGHTAGQFAKAIRKIYPKHFPFKDVLDKTFKRELYDYNRGNRRIAPLFKKTFVPRVRTEDFKVWAIVDMSGSCEFHAPDFMGYITALPQFEAIYCIDTKIHHVVKKGEPIPKMVYGCGGTDMNPALKVCEEIEKRNPSVRCNFIMLTDGEIPEVECGPRNSLFLTFTTHLSVHFKKASRKWQNIDISEKLENGRDEE